MPDLLLELLSEEIPARMQARAAEDLKKLVTDALIERGLVYEGAKAFATPRRLALHIAGLPMRQPDTREEKKGPRIGSPEGAIQGFLKSAGLSDLSEAKIESDPKKGEFYVAHIERPGSATLDVLAEIIPAVIRAFPWPKSMRWGKASASSASLKWVRPLRSVLATFGGETEEPEIVPFEVDGLKAGNVTTGHRFMAGGAIVVRRFDDYTAKLEAARVVLDATMRKAIIRADAQTLAFAQGLELIEDEGLLDEVAGLVEWPVVLMGRFEEAFLDIPDAVIRATIRANQKCFVLRGADGKLANRFLLVANLAASDGGTTIIAGNERVIRARLSDAKFFWETDKTIWAADNTDLKRLERFKNVTFHEKLGSQWERIERIRALAKELCKVTGADAALVDRAARLCKLDLQTEIVGEFPEVQGLMGRIYAALNGEHPAVAAACEEHYKPAGPSDFVPRDTVSITIALADKLDTLVGFWAIDEKPTGSKDPYALRRAALGVIRLVVENGVRFKLVAKLLAAFWHTYDSLSSADNLNVFDVVDGSYRMRFVAAKFTDREVGKFSSLFPSPDEILPVEILSRSWIGSRIWPEENESEYNAGAPLKLNRPLVTTEDRIRDLLAFFHDRLKGMLRDHGARHDLVDAVLGNGEPNDDLLLVVRRVEALGTFLDTEDGKSLLAGFKRAANILRAEEKKDGDGAFEMPADAAHLIEPEEQALHTALATAEAATGTSLANQDFEGGMRAMAKLRAPVDAFFEKLMVNAEDAAIRRNRLALLATLRRVTRQVADFLKIAG